MSASPISCFKAGDSRVSFRTDSFSESGDSGNPGDADDSERCDDSTMTEFARRKAVKLFL
jgi:hypothetical protein